MLGNMTSGAQASRDGSNQYGLMMSMNTLQGSEHLEAGHPMLGLIESSNQQAGSNAGRSSQMEFLQQQQSTGGADSGGDNSSRGGGSTVDSPDLKYPELQALRPGSYGTSSIYDAHHNLL